MIQALLYTLIGWLVALALAYPAGIALQALVMWTGRLLDWVLTWAPCGV